MSLRCRGRHAGHRFTDRAVAVALDGDTCDIAVLRARPGVFGPVASDRMVSRLIAHFAEGAEAALAAIDRR